MNQELYHNALPLGYQLHEYMIDTVLGVGNFGITYLAIDANLHREVAIKEYLPSAYALRKGNDVLVKSSKSEILFKWGLERFLDEARTLAHFKHHNIVQVLRFFQAHNTAYMVMEYEQGESLAQILKNQTSPPSEEYLINLLNPLLQGLEVVHKGNFLHRDIKPENIFIRSDGSPVLLDFGAARHAISCKNENMTAIVTASFSPFEQYLSDGNQGPWTDIYALSAVMYYAMTGKRPVDAMKRVKKDTLVSVQEILQERYSKNLLESIDWGLVMDEKLRPQSIEEWRKSLPRRDRRAEERRGRKKHRRRIFLFILLLLGMGLGYMGYLFWMQKNIKIQQDNELYTMAVQGNQEVDYDNYLQKCTLLGCLHQQKAILQLENLRHRRKQNDKQAYLYARQTHTEASYLDYLNECRQWGCLFAEKAITDLEALKTPQQRVKKNAIIQHVPGEVWVEAITQMPFVWMPASAYEMGCGEWSGVCKAHEKPLHKVFLDGFWIAKYEVTQGQWTKIMGNNPSNFKKGDNYPVESVSWYDAKKFIHKLEDLTQGKYHFSLPTEAQWEYACRSGGEQEQYAGGDDVKALAYYNQEWTAGHTIVGSKQENGLGVYDMSGNVWEWVEDTYSNNAYESSVHGKKNPLYQDHGKNRVYRGGGWFEYAGSQRCSARFDNDGNEKYYYIGFRIVRLEQ